MDRCGFLKLLTFGGGGVVLGIGTSTPNQALASEGGSNWGYVGEGGPNAWGTLSSTYSACQSGLQQSPIDIHDGVGAKLVPVAINYQPFP